MSLEVDNTIKWHTYNSPLQRRETIRIVLIYVEIKLPTRCNRGFYCRSYCLLNMFRASLCPSSGVQEYYTVVAACGISCCGFQVVGLVWSWGLCVRFAGCSTPDQQLENHSTKYRRQQPLYNTLELLMMGIVVPETCWASNKICNKNLCCI